MVTQVALITGASRGLGLEVARAYASRGLRLILTARGAEALQLAADELLGTGSAEVLAVPADVGNPTDAERLVEAGLSAFGRIDVLVNNASELGPSPLPDLEHLPIDSFADVLRVNVVGSLKLIQLVLPGMKSRGSGLIVNVTSDAGVQAYPTWGGYGASKAALEHLSRVLVEELEGSGVRVFVVDPGDGTGFKGSSQHCRQELRRNSTNVGAQIAHFAPECSRQVVRRWRVEKIGNAFGRQLPKA